MKDEVRRSTSPSLLPIHPGGLKGINVICYGFRDGRGKKKEKLGPGLHIEASGIINSRAGLQFSVPGSYYKKLIKL